VTNPIMKMLILSRIIKRKIKNLKNQMRKKLRFNKMVSTGHFYISFMLSNFYRQYIFNIVSTYRAK
jgi:hypothetical protein